MSDYNYPEKIESQVDAYNAISLHRRAPNMTPTQALAQIETIARKNGWIDVIQQVQLARSRDAAETPPQKTRLTQSPRPEERTNVNRRRTRRKATSTE